jgi:hypothetical protein
MKIQARNSTIRVNMRVYHPLHFFRTSNDPSHYVMTTFGKYALSQQINASGSFAPINQSLYSKPEDLEAVEEREWDSAIVTRTYLKYRPGAFLNGILPNIKTISNPFSDLRLVLDPRFLESFFQHLFFSMNKYKFNKYGKEDDNDVR